jgi:hypothetical protein
LIVGFAQLVKVTFDCRDGSWWVATKRLRRETWKVDNIVAIEGILEGGQGR